MINNINDSSVQHYLHCPIKRHDIINHLIRYHNYTTYLEIGVFDGLNMQKINTKHKDGVDPGAEGIVPPEVNYPMTSDEFFNQLAPNAKYDIIFIDGLHQAEQVIKDIENSLKHLNTNGTIVLHDCNPPNELVQQIPRKTIAWTGNVWKAFVSFRSNNPQINSYTIDTDWGVGVIPFTSDKLNYILNDITWNSFDQNRKKYLGLITVENFYENNIIS